MLAINIIFAGFVLTLNGISFFEKAKIDQKVKGAANALVGVLIAINAVLQTISATTFYEFGFAAAMWLFAANYLILAFYIFLKAENYGTFGVFSAFATIVSLIFAIEQIITLASAYGHWMNGIFIFLWGMWALLWLQSFLSTFFNNKFINKLTPYILIANGVLSTFVPGMLMVLGVI